MTGNTQEAATPDLSPGDHAGWRPIRDLPSDMTRPGGCRHWRMIGRNGTEYVARRGLFAMSGWTLCDGSNREPRDPPALFHPEAVWDPAISLAGLTPEQAAALET